MTKAELANSACATEGLFDRYHIGWETKNPDLIASLHSVDTVFQVHDGSEAVVGRDALHLRCLDMFKAYPFTFEMGRRLFGDRHWVFEWLMVLQLDDRDGKAFVAKVEMLDVVTLNENGEVTRKDVYMNGRQAQEGFSRAGIER